MGTDKRDNSTKVVLLLLLVLKSVCLGLPQMFFWAEAKTGPHVIMDLSPISNSTSAIQSMTPKQLKYNNQSKSI